MIARLEQPLLEPDGERAKRIRAERRLQLRCAIVHDGMLWIPYGIGDDRIRVAYVPVSEVLEVR